MTTSSLDLTLRENNDEVINCSVINDDFSSVDITGYTVEAIVKPKPSSPDTDGFTLSTDTGEITVEDAATGKVRVSVSRDKLTAPGKRFWRLDVVDTGNNRRTCGYGNITIIDL